jgi:SAM-dependent methyltransferase
MSAPEDFNGSLEWDARSFYERQEELSRAYSGDVSDYHRSKAVLIGRHCGPTRRVLELGAGGGQMAVATAELGFTVDAVELSPLLAAHARELAARNGIGVNVIEGDFYTVAIAGRYGAVTYWDGFGLGTDSDQQALLRRVRGWLADDGRALIDIYTPWYWKGVAGLEMTAGTARHRYDYDTQTHTMTNTWWADEAPDKRVSQHLRCYAPDELEQLLETVELTVELMLPGGAYDHDRSIYRELVPLDDAMSYTAIIARS